MSKVSALVCTRNRPSGLVRIARSLLDDAELPHELLVIDQSDGNDTELALAPLAGDARLRYVRSRTRGKGAALNEGLALAQGEIVVCTDDDCEAPRGWVAGIAGALEQNPSAAIAFSNVSAPPYDESAGYVPTYLRSESRLVRSVNELCGGYGIGAGMALRRKPVLDFGGCDEALGPGARFPAAEDLDLALRALLLGFHVYETSEVSIIHHGFRTFEEGREHARRDWRGLGALCSKPIRGGKPRGAVPTLYRFALYALWPPVSDALHLRKPRGLARVSAFVGGFAEGLRTPVDRARLMFARERTRTRSA